MLTIYPVFSSFGQSKYVIAHHVSCVTCKSFGQSKYVIADYITSVKQLWSNQICNCLPYIQGSVALVKANM